MNSFWYMVCLALHKIYSPSSAAFCLLLLRRCGLHGELDRSFMCNVLVLTTDISFRNFYKMFIMFSRFGRNTKLAQNIINSKTPLPCSENIQIPLIDPPWEWLRWRESKSSHQGAGCCWSLNNVWCLFSVEDSLQVFRVNCGSWWFIIFCMVWTLFFQGRVLLLFFSKV